MSKRRRGIRWTRRGRTLPPEWEAWVGEYVLFVVAGEDGRLRSRLGPRNGAVTLEAAKRQAVRGLAAQIRRGLKADTRALEVLERELE